jgi:hypothetical protein
MPPVDRPIADYYGESCIPAEWRSKLALKELLDRYAELLAHDVTRVP